jgi:acetylornithine deacetylase
MAGVAALDSSYSAVGLLDRLVAFPTVSRDGNRPLIDFVQAYLAANGIAATLVPGPGGDKAALFATIGPDRDNGVILSAHTDVVPVDGQPWTSDPFRLTERDGRLIGRGALDMKAYLACILAVVPEAARSRLSRPLHLAFSYDEEIGCQGIRPLLDAMATAGVRASGCIVGEPTGMKVVRGHKGKLAGSIVCTGRAAHSALPHLGFNAIHLGAAMVDALRRIQADIEAHGSRDDAYAVPFTTVHVGTIHGGTALNVVPERCTLAFEIRHLAADDPHAVLARIVAEAGRLTETARAVCADAGVEVAIDNAYPGLETPPDAAIVSLAHAAGGIAASEKVTFGTEAGVFQEQLGLPAVVCGPGDMVRAHKADEYVTREELGACEDFLRRVVQQMAD